MLSLALPLSLALCRYLVTMFVSAHWLGCGWWMFASFQVRERERAVEESRWKRASNGSLAGEGGG